MWTSRGYLVEYYIDPNTGIRKRISVKLSGDSEKAKQGAIKRLTDKLNKLEDKKILLSECVALWLKECQRAIKPSTYRKYRITFDSIQKIIGVKENRESQIVQSVATVTANPTVESYLKRVKIFLEDGEWEKANEYCEKVLDVDPECAYAYLGKFMGDYKIQTEDKIELLLQDYSQNYNYIKTLKYADDVLKTRLDSYMNTSKMTYKKLEFIAIIKGLCNEKKKKTYIIPEGIQEINCDNIDINLAQKAETLIIPESVKNIRANDLSNDAATNVTIMFKNFKNLKEIIVAEQNNQYKTIDGILYSKDMSVLVRYPIKKSGDYLIPDEVITIYDEAFRDCIMLSKIRIPSSVNSIGTRAFLGCNSLKDIIIDDGVKQIGVSAFEQCSKLEYIKLPDSVEFIGNFAFFQCQLLKEIRMPMLISEVNGSIFGYCTSLKQIDSPHLMVENGIVCNLGKTKLMCYLNCNNDREYSVPNCFDTIGEHAFYYCLNLKEIKLPDSIVSIASYAFFECKSLKNINIPHDVSSIGNGAFSYCQSLAKIVLPECVKTIGNAAFANCKSLNDMVVPECVNYIGDDAFIGCNHLSLIILPQKFCTNTEKERLSLLNYDAQILTLEELVKIDEEKRKTAELKRKNEEEKAKIVAENNKKRDEIQATIQEKEKEIFALTTELESLFFLSPKKKDLKNKIGQLESEISELRNQKNNL